MATKRKNGGKIAIFKNEKLTEKSGWVSFSFPLKEVLGLGTKSTTGWRTGGIYV